LIALIGNPKLWRVPSRLDVTASAVSVKSILVDENNQSFLIT
jgi:hypothetical protein